MKLQRHAWTLALAGLLTSAAPLHAHDGPAFVPPHNLRMQASATPAIQAVELSGGTLAAPDQGGLLPGDCVAIAPTMERTITGPPVCRVLSAPVLSLELEAGSAYQVLAVAADGAVQELAFGRLAKPPVQIDANNRPDNKPQLFLLPPIQVEREMTLVVLWETEGGDSGFVALK